MAVNPLPDVPYKTTVLDSRGFLTPTWAAFFRELFNRVGKNIAPSNTDLAGLVDGEAEALGEAVEVLQEQMISITARVVVVEGGLTKGRQL